MLRTNLFSIAAEMECLKVDEYIKRTVSVTETKLLLQELQVSIATEPGRKQQALNLDFLNKLVWQHVIFAQLCRGS